MAPESDGVEYVPERNWRSRASPMLYVPGVPRDILREYLTIKKRFGIDIANLVISAYSSWGKRVARSLAYKILQFDSFEEVINYLEGKISLFDSKSKRILSGLIFRFKYDFYFDGLLRIISNHEHTCPGVRDNAVRVFHVLASRGLFYSPDCIVEYVMVKLGCAEKIRNKCKAVAKNIDTYCKDVTEVK